MNRGYIKLWRKSSDSGWFKNPNLWTFWCWCLTKASHKEIDIIVGYQKVHLMPGDFIFGRRSASIELGMSERTIRTNLDSLRKRKNVTIKTTNKFSIISVINWDIYQSDKSTSDQQSDQQVTSKRPASDHKQECKAFKNVKNKNIVPYKSIIDYLNEKAGTHFKHTTAETKHLIKARFNQGFDLSAFQYVIDLKCKQWMTNEKMINFLRPQTLFGTKFESYLNERV